MEVLHDAKVMHDAKVLTDSKVMHDAKVLTDVKVLHDANVPPDAFFSCDCDVLFSLALYNEKMCKTAVFSRLFFHGCFFLRSSRLFT